MANTDSAFGFRPISKDGSPYNGGTQRCSIISTNTTATFIGDAVILDGTSNFGYPGVEQAAAGAGNGVYGVITAFEASPATSLDDQYAKTLTARFCQVVSVIDQEFECQADGVMVASESGLNADMKVAAGSTTYGVSGMEIDSTTDAATSTLDLQMVRPVDRADNDASLTNSKWIVRFNRPRTAQSGLGSLGQA